MILDGLKSFFIPSEGFIQGKLEELKSLFMSKIGLEGHTEILTGLIGEEKPFKSVNIDFELGGVSYSGVIFDATYINPIIERFRPFIQATICLWILVFNVRQFHSVIGIDSGADDENA